MLNNIATRLKAPVKGFAAFATAAPEEVAAVDERVALPALPELAAEPLADDLAEAEAALDFEAALPLALALALVMGVATAINISIRTRLPNHLFMNRTYHSQHPSQW